METLATTLLKFVSDPGLKLCGPFKPSVTTTNWPNSERWCTRDVCCRLTVTLLWDSSGTKKTFLILLGLYFGCFSVWEAALEPIIVGPNFSVQRTFLVKSDSYVFVQLAEKHSIFHVLRQYSKRVWL